MSILEVNDLKKIYTTRFGGQKVEALQSVSFKVERGEWVAIMGESGSGKTTLLNLVAALDRPTGGAVLLNGKNLAQIKESSIAAFRRDNLGFVFQDCNLLDTFSLADNIYLPLVLAAMPYKEMAARIGPLAERLGIAGLLGKYPYEVSGGQKQRAAVARALFRQINESGQTILLVTHSVKAASYAGRVLFIKDGRVFHQLYRAGQPRQQFYQKITEALTLLTSDGGLAEAENAAGKGGVE